MARPTKSGLDYFPMDADFFCDRKIKRLRRTFGDQGVIVFQYLLCEIYRDKGYYVMYEDSLVIDVANEFGYTESLVRDIVTFCAKAELFSQRLLDDYQVITSTGIQKRYFEILRQLRRNAVEVVDDYFLLDRTDLPNGSVRMVSRTKNNRYRGENPGYSGENPGYSGENAKENANDRYCGENPGYCGENPGYSGENATEVVDDYCLLDRSDTAENSVKIGRQTQNNSYCGENPSYCGENPDYSGENATKERKGKEKKLTTAVAVVARACACASAKPAAAAAAADEGHSPGEESVSPHYECPLPHGTTVDARDCAKFAQAQEIGIIYPSNAITQNRGIYGDSEPLYSPAFVQLLNDIGDRFHLCDAGMYAQQLQRLLLSIHSPGADDEAIVRQALAKLDTAKAICSGKVQMSITRFLRPDMFLKLLNGDYDIDYAEKFKQNNKNAKAGQSFEDVDYSGFSARK